MQAEELPAPLEIRVPCRVRAGGHQIRRRRRPGREIGRNLQVVVLPNGCLPAH